MGHMVTRGYLYQECVKGEGEEAGGEYSQMFMNSAKQ